MPEGPEVRLEADRIAKALAGRCVREVFFGIERLQKYAPMLQGSSVSDVTTRGKALLTQFDSGYTLFSHNQLYGRWYVRKRGRLPNTARSLRVALHTDKHSALLYSASNIEVLKTSEVSEHAFIKRLGPDVLDGDLQWQAIAQRLIAQEFRGRTLSALYLDQHFLAGIGNYLRSEILFDARVNPKDRPRDLKRGEIERLARSTVTLSRRSYRTAGSTNSPKRVAALRRAGVTRSRYRFAAFARDSQPCYRCATSIEKVQANGRRLYLCPGCQPSPQHTSGTP